MPRTTRRLAALIAATLLLPVIAVGPAAAAGTSIVVTTTADTAISDGVCSLHEAIDAANLNIAVDACPAGSASESDTITFAVAGTITEAGYLPAITSDLTIDGGGKITISGATLYRPITITAGIVAVKNLTVTLGYDNVAFGGGIYNNGATTLTDVTVSGSSSSAGGGIMNLGTLTINDSTIFGNSALNGGGVYNTGTVTIARSTFSGNSAGNGGALRSPTGTATIANSTLSGNTASTYSGAISNSATLTVINTTISGNTAGSAVGGINDDGTSTIVNSIVAGNTPEDTSNGIDTTIASLVGVSTTGLLDPAGLADNGGPTKTIRLLSTATTAIDHGDASACALSPVSGLDQRGVARAGSCDIGAYEIEHTAPTATAPAATLRSGIQLAGSALPVHLAWTGADNAKLDHYVLERSVNGGPWTTVNAALTSPAYDGTLAKSSAYRFRVHAVDVDGNVSSTVQGPLLGAVLVQQTSSAVKYNTTWTKASSVAYSGGSVKYKKSKGASASFTFTGRSIAVVTTKGPTRGKAKIYINGSYVTTIDLRASSTSYRVLAFQKTWSTKATRKIKIVVSGTSGRPRVDLDAFAVLK